MSMEEYMGNVPDPKKLIESLQSDLDEAVRALEFYSQGGNNSDYWYHADLGYFIGKRAKETLAKIKRKVEG